MREYLAELEGILAEAKVAPKDPERLAKWLDWAHWYVQYVDPLSSTKSGSSAAADKCQNRGPGHHNALA